MGWDGVQGAYVEYYILWRKVIAYGTSLNYSDLSVKITASCLEVDNHELFKQCTRMSNVKTIGLSLRTRIHLWSIFCKKSI
jgi:hypothetical protein